MSCEDREIPIPRFAWSDVGSAYAMDALRDEVGPRLLGEADGVFFWENGSVSGIRFSNGKVIECDVPFTLAPKT